MAPLGLLGATALGHARVLIAVFLIAGGSFAPALGPAWGFALGQGVLGLPAFGFLLGRLPLWYGRSSVHYVRYGTLNLLGLTGLLALEVGLFAGQGWLLLGAALVSLAWFPLLLALRGG